MEVEVGVVAAHLDGNHIPGLAQDPGPIPDPDVQNVTLENVTLEVDLVPIIPDLVVALTLPITDDPTHRVAEDLHHLITVGDMEGTDHTAGRPCLTADDTKEIGYVTCGCDGVRV